MALPPSGTITAAQINSEFGRGSTATMSIYDARNGSYGAINNASGKRPTANGQTGYAWSNWWGYDNGASFPTIYIYEEEAQADTNVRIYAWNNYGVNYISELWFFYSGTYNLASESGQTIRQNDQIQALWSWLNGWGSGSTYTYKRVYSTSRGYLYIGDGPTQDTVYTSFYPLSGETIYVQAIN